ncbi:MAG: hypothetical protein JKP98_06160 [Rhodobacteraceae bacterium]|jgi:hypothetical protein|nr:hypothetical protein [Paracoccaceae bacterium]MBL4556902.1 hypothetical protein [Paracoccaceae bacterium]HBG97281.1 hypothetical protein [Paracoccaceae bacterium]
MHRTGWLWLVAAVCGGLPGCTEGAGGGAAAPAGYGPVDAVPTVQEAACMAAVAGRAGSRDVVATWTSYAVEGSTVYVRAAGGVWSCAVTNTGRVTGLAAPAAG